MAEERDDAQISLASIDWASWLQTYLRGLPVEPEPEPYFDDRYLCLEAFLDEHGLAGDPAFLNGIGLAIEATPPRPENAEVLYYLLDLVSAFTPVGAKEIVRQRLYGGALAQCVFDRSESEDTVDLQTQALSVSAAYGMDASLAEFIVQQLPAAADFRFVLTSLRLLGRWTGKFPARHLRRAILAISSKEDSDRLIEEMLRASESYGYRELAEWMIENRQNWNLLQTSAWRLFRQSWGERAPSWQAALQREDIYQMTVSAISNPSQVQLAPEGLVELANRFRTAEMTIVAHFVCTLVYQSLASAYIVDLERSFFRGARSLSSPAPIRLGWGETIDETIEIPEALYPIFRAAEEQYEFVD